MWKRGECISNKKIESAEYLERDKASWQGHLTSLYVLVGQQEGKQCPICDFSQVISDLKVSKMDIQSGKSVSFQETKHLALLSQIEVLRGLMSPIQLGPFLQTNLRLHSKAELNNQHSFNLRFHLYFLLARACRHWARDLNSSKCHNFDSRRPFSKGGR